MSEHPQYDIRTVQDFLQVPEPRRAICLKEFATWLKIHDAVVTLLTPPEHPNAVQWTYFRWIDDGERNVSIKMEVVAGSIAKDSAGSLPESQPVGGGVETQDSPTFDPDGRS